MSVSIGTAVGYLDLDASKFKKGLEMAQNSLDKASREFRKFTPDYFKGAVGVKQLKAKLVTANSTEEIFRLINQNL